MTPPIMGETVFLAEASIKPQQSKHIDDFKMPVRKLQTTDNVDIQTMVKREQPTVHTTPLVTQEDHDSKPYKVQLVWLNITGFAYLHLAAVYGVYLLLTRFQFNTNLFWLLCGLFSGIGITGGAHRLWAHRSYKAKWPLRLILTIAQTIAFQNSVYDWVRDHRMHHKFTDTNADPHNSKRGFFFSHMGWLLMKKHPDIKTKGKTIDMSDLESDPIVMFQHRFYWFLIPLFCFIIPTMIPYFWFGQDFATCYYGCGIFRYILSLHLTWFVNSVAHIWGDKPYDKAISPTQTFWVSFFTNGEGFHNYHHTFPWDYKAAELGNYYGNGTTAIIDMFSKIGWAYDLKTVKADMIRARIIRTGDGTHRLSRESKDKLYSVTNTAGTENSHENLVWGWGDPDMEEDEITNAAISCKQD